MKKGIFNYWKIWGKWGENARQVWMFARKIEGKMRKIWSNFLRICGNVMESGKCISKLFQVSPKSSLNFRKISQQFLKSYFKMSQEFSQNFCKIIHHFFFFRNVRESVFATGAPGHQDLEQDLRPTILPNLQKILKNVPRSFAIFTWSSFFFFFF